MQQLLKQPSELLRVPVVFPGAVAAVLSIGAVARGLVAGALALGALGEEAGGQLTAAITGGTDGERYLVTVAARLVDGQELEAELEVAVVDGAWAMPDGGAPYLSIKAFVEAIGLPAALELADTSGTGRIDRTLLVGALRAAQATVDAHLAGRYQLPLPPPVPPLVETIVADLARARLHTREAPEGVERAAKAAERLLGQIMRGELPLGVPAAQAPAATASDAPVLVAPGERAYPDNLAGY